MSTPPPRGPVMPPQGAVMQMMMAAWTAQTISAVTSLGVADLVARHGPLTARALVETHGIAAQPALLERALRACASVGIFTESADGRFGPTPLSDVLTVDAPASVRRFVELIGGRWWPLFGAMPDVLREGQRPPAPWRTDDEAHTRAFAEAMKSQVEGMRAVVEHGDFARARHLVDVGGSFGHLAVALLDRHPALRATVLDLPPVIALAERYAATVDPAVRARLTLVGGDMFADVPPADTYVLKTIIHDWDDESSVRVLGNCRARLTTGGRVVCVDKVLPPMGDTSASGAKLLDMLMMVSLPGKERTEAEWRALYAAADLAVTSITTINPRSGDSLIEGVPRSA
jgi:hypothetical protein